MKKNTVVTIALVSIPLIVGGFFIFKALKNDPKGKKDVPPIDENKGNGEVKTPAPSDFPLKKGSKNDYVGVLQTLLNTMGEKLVIDKAFGKLTEAALQRQFNLTQVDSKATLDGLKNRLTQTNVKAKNYDYGSKLTNAFKGGVNYLVPLQDFQMNEVRKNVFGQWKDTALGVTLKRGVRYNSDDYVIVTPMNTGQLRIQITKGDLAGFYLTPMDKDLSQLLDLE
jgi:hypothetical protein